MFQQHKRIIGYIATLSNTDGIVMLVLDNDEIL